MGEGWVRIVLFWVEFGKRGWVDIKVEILIFISCDYWEKLRFVLYFFDVLL